MLFLMDSLSLPQWKIFGESVMQFFQGATELAKIFIFGEAGGAIQISKNIQ